ncbi:MAG: hypothetical protein EPO20_28925 [Betaproteobacteria bacterium]|nr:MAG: hypothetical protein EPO20_28925 [Betaproteobacteria bacterium]
MDGDSAELELQGRFTQDKAGYNPLTHGLVTATRRAVKRDFDLPMRERYGALLAELFEPLGAEVAHAS